MLCRAAMKTAFLLSMSILAAACGGGVADGPGAPPSSAGSSGAARPDDGTTSEGTTSPPEEASVGGTCTAPASVLVRSGGSIARPAGSVLRFELVYQGDEIGVRALRGVDMIISGSDGPFTPGHHAGYWAETRDASGAALFTRLLRDPTVLEAPGAPGGGGFSNHTIDRCEPKTIPVDVPSSASAQTLVIFGSPYGTSEGAAELARFTLL